MRSKSDMTRDTATQARDERIALRVIQRFARGNVRMQQGALLTRQRLDERAAQRKKLVARLRELYGV